MMYILINIQPTIGIDFFTKFINFRENSIRLQIWDSAGQERYKSLIPSYLKGASIIFLVYDVSSKFFEFVTST
jgi:GTPase SAR1 family protein